MQPGAVGPGEMPAVASPSVPPHPYGSLSAPEHAREHPPPPPLPAQELQWWLGPAAGGGTGTLCPEYGKQAGRASPFPVSSSQWERAKSACCRYFSWTGRLNYSFCSLNCTFQIPFFPPNITSALQEMSPGKCSSLRSWFLCKDPMLMGDKHGGSSPPQTFWLGRNETLLLVVFQPIY